MGPLLPTGMRGKGFMAAVREGGSACDAECGGGGMVRGAGREPSVWRRLGKEGRGIPRPL